MIVAKFGGTSLADAERIRHVAEIIRSNPERRFVVVSAPAVASGGAVCVVPDGCHGTGGAGGIWTADFDTGVL